MAAYNEKLKGGGHELALESGSGDIPAVEDFTSSSDYEPGVLASLRRFEARMDKALGVESEAIVRKTDNDKRPVPWHEELNMALIWASASLGWASVATISGGLALTAVADGHISLIIGVIIIALVLLTISFLGLKYILIYERLKVWLLTTAGIGIPTVIGITAGAIVASALNNINAWKTAYTDPHQGLSFLIRDMLHPRGFANFLLILLSFSGINTNIMSLYLSAISFHQMATPYAKVPRFVWTLGNFVIVMVLAIVGRQKLNTYLQDFLSLLGYWCTSYFVILFEEHTIFRKRDFANYDLEGWNNRKRLPPLPFFWVLLRGAKEWLRPGSPDHLAS
ncbi:hypothetical protein FOFC_07632 [Fusarium oxysporum]|nr:hypothetical protein FOFC_07632 [Fusarium oxysporum]